MFAINHLEGARLIHHFLPPGTAQSIVPVFVARALRGFADGFIAVLLPVFLLSKGLEGIAVGAIATATLLGSALLTLAVGAWGHRWSDKALLLAAAAMWVVGERLAQGIASKTARLHCSKVEKIPYATLDRWLSLPAYQACW
jgi:MFS family permease